MAGKMDVPPKSPLAARSQTQTGIQSSQTTKRKIGSSMVMACEVGERLGSGDGERKTLLTPQIAFEPLLASVLFALVSAVDSCIMVV